MISQGTKALPVTFHVDEERTTLNPYDINMQFEFGPVKVLNDDRGIELEEERQTFDGWFFKPSIDGATISLYEGDIVVMYVQIADPSDPTQFESWSCSADYQMKDTVYVGQVYNYKYGDVSLSNDAVERESATPAKQTLDHIDYVSSGPWMSANSLAWYTQEYSVEDNQAGVACTAIRRYGDGHKGFFDLPVGDTVSINMGFRVYKNAEATRAFIHRDYPDRSFDLLGAKSYQQGGVSKVLALSSMVSALVFSLVF